MPAKERDLRGATFDVSEQAAQIMLGTHALRPSCRFLVGAYASLRNNASFYNDISLYNNTFPHDKAIAKHCLVIERSDAKRVGCDNSATQHRPTKSSVAPLSRLPSPTGLPLLASSHS